MIGNTGKKKVKGLSSKVFEFYRFKTSSNLKLPLNARQTDSKQHHVSITIRLFYVLTVLRENHFCVWNLAAVKTLIYSLNLALKYQLIK